MKTPAEIRTALAAYDAAIKNYPPEGCECALVTMVIIRGVLEWAADREPAGPVPPIDNTVRELREFTAHERN